MLLKHIYQDGAFPAPGKGCSYSSVTSCWLVKRSLSNNARIPSLKIVERVLFFPVCYLGSVFLSSNKTRHM